MSTTSKSISFRLHNHYMERLEERAVASNLSPDKEARRCVMQILDNSVDEEFRAGLLKSFADLDTELQNLKEQTADIKASLTLAVQAILIASTHQKQITPAEAAQWVKDNLQPKS